MKVESKTVCLWLLIKGLIVRLRLWILSIEINQLYPERNPKLRNT